MLEFSIRNYQPIWCIKSIVSWSSNEESWISEPTIPLYVSRTYEAMEDNSRNTSLIVEVENLSLERALVAQRSETCFVYVMSLVRFPPGSVGAHCWRVPNRTKQLFSVPASFRLSTLLINDEFLIENSNKIPYYSQIILRMPPTRSSDRQEVIKRLFSVCLVVFVIINILNNFILQVTFWTLVEY